MIFTKDNVERICRGAKTETRRLWKGPHVRVGGVYTVRSDRFAPASPSMPRIRVIALEQERLGELTEDGARREGVASVAEFRSLWTELHGAWDPSRVVYVVRFEVLR